MKSMIPLVLQGAPLQVHADLWRLWLTPGEPESSVLIRKKIDPRAPIAWRELDKLRDLVEIDYAGIDPGVVKYVTSRPSIKRLRWTDHGQTRIDLSRSKLQELAVETSGPLELRLPASLRELRLAAAKQLSKLTIHSADAGAQLEVLFWEPRGKVPFLPGLAGLRSLTFMIIAKVDLAPFAKYTALKKLRVCGVEHGVAIAKLATLAKLPSLESIELRNAYHTDFSAFPRPDKLPSLTSLTIDGIRADAAAHIKELFVGKRLTVRGVRTDAWLEKNADNPFREWEGPLRARATNAYRSVKAAKVAPEKALATFISAFNAVQDEIDTIQREEIAEAFDELAKDLGVPSKRATTWFEKWREF